MNLFFENRKLASLRYIIVIMKQLDDTLVTIQDQKIDGNDNA